MYGISLRTLQRHNCTDRPKLKSNCNGIEKFCDTIANRDDIWYATNIEIYDYIEVFCALRFTTDSNTIFNPTFIPIYIFVLDTKKQHIIQPGEGITL